VLAVAVSGCCRVAARKRRKWVGSSGTGAAFKPRSTPHKEALAVDSCAEVTTDLFVVLRNALDVKESLVVV
jgi:hypothetical protein